MADDVSVNGNGAMRVDADPGETREWMESLDYVIEQDRRSGADRVHYLFDRLQARARMEGVSLLPSTTTPYCNSIPVTRQTPRQGDPVLERKIKSIVRWNALGMVVRANIQKGIEGIGGHISTYASSSTLYEVGFNHFFRGPKAEGGGDQVFFQGHASPGVYARAFVEGRLTEQQLKNFRRELGEGGGLSSYPHPWLMPEFWQFPTVSMGLGPIMSLYAARFNRYLQHRGIKDTSQGRVWAFLGDGECDEPETLGCITLAARERLDNLTWVVNCNLQRLDGPVRGNGKIIQELEGLFLGAGWNVIKVVWGSDWDALFAADHEGVLLERMMELPDGQFQKYSVSSGAFIREDFFGKDPRLLKLVENYSDEQLRRLRRGGHDPSKVFAAYAAAVAHKGQPTVILAKTVKGYSLGEYGEGMNTAHNQKSLGKDEEGRAKAALFLRDRYEIPLSDEQAMAFEFYRPAEDSPEMKYLRARREELGGYLPQRRRTGPEFKAPGLEAFQGFLGSSEEREISTTQALVRILPTLLRDKTIGKYIVPIVPDEARTFGMDGLFASVGIYSSKGQLYTPVDRDQMQYYKESKNGQILQEGINEAGAMADFIAAGTAYSVHGVNMIPFYIYYSMFGFQRVGDLIWAAGDMRCRGFLIGGTAGRTTLNGEGLQHEDGHSHLAALTVPNIRAYDPAFMFELAVIIQDGIKRMYEDGEDVFYYITLENEGYVHLGMPEGAAEGILRGIYKLKPGAEKKKHKVQLWGSGAILNCALAAQQILEKFDVSADVWSVTSYKALRHDAMEVERWNRLHPTETPRKAWIQEVMAKDKGPVVAASDYMKILADQVLCYLDRPWCSLGTDGFGRSESRGNLRRHFEVDGECIALAALHKLAQTGDIPAKTVAAAIKDLGIDPEKPWSVLM